jgi:hypothetical protein
MNIYIITVTKSRYKQTRLLAGEDSPRPQTLEVSVEIENSAHEPQAVLETETDRLKDS